MRGARDGGDTLKPDQGLGLSGWGRARGMVLGLPVQDLTNTHTHSEIGSSKPQFVHKVPNRHTHTHTHTD